MQEFRRVRAKIEKQKIDHVTVEKAIGEIAQDSCEKKTKSNASPRIEWPPTKEQCGNNDQRDNRERDEKAIVIAE